MVDCPTSTLPMKSTFRRRRACAGSRHLKRIRSSPLNRPAVGLSLTVFVEVKVSRHSRETSDRIEQALSGLREVVSCHLVSGAADFLLQVAVTDLAAYERFLLDRLLTLPSVMDVRSNFAIRTIKARSPLPLDHLAEPR